MKKLYRKSIVCLLALLCALSLAACGGKGAADAGITPEMQDYLVQTAKGLFENTVELVGSEYEQRAGRIPLYEKSMESWRSAMEAVGEVDPHKVSEEQVKKVDEETYEVRFRVSGDEHDAVIVTRLKEIYDDQQQQFYISPDSVVTNVDYSFGELLGQAGLNTILGMGTTFLVLILLTLIISLFGVLNRYQQQKEEKKAAQKAAAQAEEARMKAAREAAPAGAAASAAGRAPSGDGAADPAFAAALAGAIAASGDGTLQPGVTISPMPSDPALIAVITAAAYAAQQEKPAPDVFVARSLRRRNRRK